MDYSTAERFRVRPFEPSDQVRVRNLVHEGLAEHFQDFIPALNSDLDDIETNYIHRGALFLVVETNEELVGTGALIEETETIGRIVRVSVAKSHRRMGIGRLITAQLIKAAVQYRYQKIVVETNDNWYDAIRLYKSCGFFEYDRRDGEVHMMLHL